MFWWWKKYLDTALFILMRLNFSISMKDIICTLCLQVYLHGWNRFWKLALVRREPSQKDISKCQHFLLLCHWLLVCFQNDLVLSWIKKQNGNRKNLYHLLLFSFCIAKQFIAKNSLSFLPCHFKCPMLNRKCYKNVSPHFKRFKWLTIKWKTVKCLTLVRAPWNIYSLVVFFSLLCHFIGSYSVQLCLGTSMHKSDAPGRKKMTGDGSQA